MNKIKCEIQSNIFEDFPVGTIFSHIGDFISKSIKMKFGMTSAPRRITVSVTKLTRALCLMRFV